MPKAKRTGPNANNANDSDSDDGGFLTRFHQLPTVSNANNVEEPVRVINVRENTFSSSYVLTSSRTAIMVSMVSWSNGHLCKFIYNPT